MNVKKKTKQTKQNPQINAFVLLLLAKHTSPTPTIFLFTHKVAVVKSTNQESVFRFLKFKGIQSGQLTGMERGRDQINGSCPAVQHFSA